MDLQKLIDAMNQVSERTRGEYHVTLGSLIKRLEELPPSTPVRFSDAGCPGEEDSYRGYYSDLAFCSMPGETTAGDLLTRCQKALDHVYTGYKGGDYRMHVKTPLWRAEYGNCGDAIVRAEFDGSALVLHCKPED